MDDKRLIIEISSALQKYKLDSYNSLKPQVQQQLFSIELYFQECIGIFKITSEKLNSINLSVRGVCLHSKIGKSTVYQNKEILLNYIENRIKDIEEKYDIFSKKQLSTLKQKNRLLEERLDKLIIDYIEHENLALKVEEFNNTIDRLQKQIDLLSIERHELVKRNNDLLNELLKYRNVVHLTQK